MIDQVPLTVPNTTSGYHRTSASLPPEPVSQIIMPHSNKHTLTVDAMVPKSAKRQKLEVAEAAFIRSLERVPTKYRQTKNAMAEALEILYCTFWKIAKKYGVNLDEFLIDGQAAFIRSLERVPTKISPHHKSYERGFENLQDCILEDCQEV